MCNIVTMKRDAVDSLQPSVRCRCSVLDMLFHSNVVTRTTSNLSIALFLLVFFNSFNKMPENWPLEKKKAIFYHQNTLVSVSLLIHLFQTDTAISVTHVCTG